MQGYPGLFASLSVGSTSGGMPQNDESIERGREAKGRLHVYHKRTDLKEGSVVPRTDLNYSGGEAEQRKSHLDSTRKI